MIRTEKAPTISIRALLIGVFLFSLFPGTLRAEPAELSGELDVVIKEDFEHNRFERDYFLHDGHGRGWMKLEFGHKPPTHMRSGQRIRVHGNERGRKFQVHSMDEEASFEINNASSEPEASEAPIDAAGLEERKAVVIMVDLINAKSTSYTSPTIVAGQMYSNSHSVDGLYRTASLGQLGLDPDSDGDGHADVFGPFAINYDNSTCDYYNWAIAAEDAAQASGVNLSLYRHRVFVLPKSTDLPSCSWAGIANVGCGSFCRAWVAGSSAMIFAHELGHNFNMAHAGTDPENDGKINSSYGDRSDPMGISSNSFYQFNAAHIDQMGWYAGIPGAISTVVNDGIFDLAAIGMDPNSSGAPAMLKIAKADSGDFYYLSYRQQLGSYNQLSNTYTAGVNIHRYVGSGYGETTYVKTLSDGESFDDPINGFSIHQLEHNGNFATAQISFGCAQLPPSIALAPDHLVLAPNQTASYTATLSNQNTASCGPSTFALDYQGELPGSVSPASISLNPGESATAVLSIDSSGVSDGTFQIRLTASDLNSQATSRASATLVVDGMVPSPPTGLVAAVDLRGRVTILWRISNNDSSSVAGYAVLRDGKMIGRTTNTYFRDRSATLGNTYLYTVVALDAAGNESVPSSALSVTVLRWTQWR